MSVALLVLFALLAHVSVTITPGALLSLAWMSGLAPGLLPPLPLRLGQRQLPPHCQGQRLRPLSNIERGAQPRIQYDQCSQQGLV